MAMPIWGALPPEVASSMLSTGPGPGALLAAAAAWRELGAQYSDIASELAATITGSSVVWEGPSSQLYRAAHSPFLAWLAEAADASLIAAGLHDSSAAAYTVALDNMPTLLELAANHAEHAALLGTNFLGINAVPIAVNEADYVRMWLQAAAVMGTYHAVAEANLAALPKLRQPPPISNGNEARSVANQPDPKSGDAQSSFEQQQQMLEQAIRKLFEYIANPNESTFAGFVAAMQAFTILYIMNIPTALVGWALELSPLLGVLMLVGGITTGIVLPLTAGQVDMNSDKGGAPLDHPIHPRDTLRNQAVHLGIAPTSITTSVAHPSSPVTPSADGSTTTQSAPAEQAVSGTPGYAVGGDGPPSARFGPVSTASSSAKASSSASSPAVGKAEGSVAGRRSQTSRSRRGARRTQAARQERRVTADMDVRDDDVSVRASQRGSELRGFSGALSNQGITALGYVRAAEDAVGGGRTMPMLPQTWTEAENDR
ncbi:PPE family protein [Mycobacteroides abscessus]|uniref:PPE family protein n=1 Tax=Mycobacteroides abscessus TaxID=36809 RepID=UPI003F65F89E